MLWFISARFGRRPIHPHPLILARLDVSPSTPTPPPAGLKAGATMSQLIPKIRPWSSIIGSRGWTPSVLCSEGWRGVGWGQGMGWDKTREGDRQVLQFRIKHACWPDFSWAATLMVIIMIADLIMQKGGSCQYYGQFITCYVYAVDSAAAT